jgi:hypothetical protein
MIERIILYPVESGHLLCIFYDRIILYPVESGDLLCIFYDRKNYFVSCRIGRLIIFYDRKNYFVSCLIEIRFFLCIQDQEIYFDECRSRLLRENYILNQRMPSIFEKRKEHSPFYGERRSACTGRTPSNLKLVNNATVRKVTKRQDTPSAT